MHSTRVVDSNPVWWSQPESSFHRHVDVFIWGCGRNLPIIFQSTIRQPFWPPACLLFQHLLVRRDLSHLPFRKFSRGGGQWPKCGCLAPHNFAAGIVVLFRFGVPYVFFPLHLRPLKCL